MKKEDLIKLGLDEETATKVADASAEELKGFIPKQRFDEVNDKAKGYKEQLDDRDKQLEDLKKASEGNEELQKKLTELEESNTKIKEEYEAKLLKSQLDYSIDLEISKAKAKNPKALRALLDLEKVKLEDGKASGIEEQLKAIKESDSYLFEDDVPTGTGFGGSGGKPEDKKEFSKEDALKIRQGIY